MWYVVGAVLWLTIMLLARWRLRRLRAARRQYDDDIRLRIARWFDQSDDGKHTVADAPDPSRHRSSDQAEEGLKTGTESH